MLQVFPIERLRITEDSCGLFESNPVLRQVGVRLLEIPRKHIPVYTEMTLLSNGGACEYVRSVHSFHSFPRPASFRATVNANMASKEFDIRRYLSGPFKAWHGTEHDTAALVRTVLEVRGIETLSGDDLWSLFRLTWITVNRKDVAEDHWKRLKLPALALLFDQGPVVDDDLPDSLERTGIPPTVRRSAAQTTGFVNFRNVWRNTCREWCKANRKPLLDILSAARSLASNDKARFTLARRIDSLPPVKSPSGKSSIGAYAVVTPLVACLDRKNRFPVVNGREAVKELLRRLTLATGDLERQVKGIINLIGQFGIEDAFTIDVLADKIAAHVPRAFPKEANPSDETEGTSLRSFDDVERIATIKSKTVRYKNLHDRMTRRLRELFCKHELKQGNAFDCRYDVLIKNYDSNGRDLLLEAKPDPDRGSIRIAVGQLLDYRRFLPNRVATDLALITISKPPQSYVEFLHDLQITVLWFINQACIEIIGEGKAWTDIQEALNK